MPAPPTASPTHWALERRARPGRGEMLAFALLALALYAPYLGAEELHYEEARRALPARWMTESGDWVLPSIWGRPYLSKPPLIYWCIAAVGALRGAIDDVATRLPSLLSTVLSAVLVLRLGARWFSLRAGRAAALCWLLAPAVFNKGALGEIEALLGLCVLVALAALPAAAAGSWGAALASGLGLGAALLAKGPPGLIFFAAGWLALARAERRVLRDARVWGAFALGLALVGVWVALLLARLDVAATLDTWGEQLDRTGGPGLGRVLGLRFEFVGAFLGGVLAATLAAAAAGRRAWRELRAEPAFAWILGTLALSLLALMLFAPRHRYAYPVTPFLALAGGALFDRRARLDAGAPASPAARAIAALFALAGLALGAGLVPALREAAGVAFELDPWGHAFALLALGAGLALALGLRRAPLPRLGLGAVLVLVALRGLIVTQYDPSRAERRGYRAAARQIDALVPEGATLFTPVWLHFNEFTYVTHPVRWVDDLSEVPRGEHVFLRNPGAEVARGFREVGRFEIEAGVTAAVFFHRRQKPSRRE